MMFVVRTRGERPPEQGVRIKLVRRTPEIVRDSPDQVDFFCVGPDDAPERLRAEGWSVVNLHDGWYQADDEGGVAIWGQGAYWEVRDTPFSVKEAVGPAEVSAEADGGSVVDVRQSIFGV